MGTRWVSENTATLAAHLARQQAVTAVSVGFCVARAVAVAKIASRAQRVAVKMSTDSDYQEAGRLADARLEAKANAHLAPWLALRAVTTMNPMAHGLRVIGLPGNTQGGDEAGFGV